ncbi:MAG TPA: hydrogenase 4 subunit B [Chloroflexota bacterium]
MPSPDPSLMLAPVAAYLLGALLAFLDRSRGGKIPHFAALAGSLAGAALSIFALLGGGSQRLISLPVTPFATFALRTDPLAAYFALVISTVGIAASLYALGYLGDEHGSLAPLGAAYNCFLASMMLVVLADSAFAFLFAWEAMSLASFFLVIHHSRQDAVRRAGYVYLVMTHASTAFLLAGYFVLFAATGSMDFADLRAASAGLPALTKDVVFLMALVAFGTKAGVIPLHVWLPRAHPAAPSHVSALMSGVMIKVAIYGLLRVGWELVGPGPVWWGVLILALGSVSAVLGVLYALMEHDLKRLLAYHSVENIGIILMGLGAAYLLRSLGQPVGAALALLAALYHVLNHAVFKALLFLGAGAVQKATGTRDLESLGGLIHRMPWTAATFLVGAAAISAIPPLNGFASEWLTFQSLLVVASTGAVAGVGGAAAAGLLALTGGLAAFCFVKAFGIAFLGMPRSEKAVFAHEVSLSMRGGMLLLALLCGVLGVFPTAVARLLSPVTAGLAGSAAQPSLGLAPVLAAARGSLAPLPLAAGLLLAAGLALLLARLIGGPGRSRVAMPWGCGIEVEPSMQYTATALAKPVRIIFSGLLRPYREIERQHDAATPYFVSGVRYEAGIHPVYERYLYAPAVRALLGTAHQIRALQNGSLTTYLAYICATLVVVLLLAR